MALPIKTIIVVSIVIVVVIAAALFYNTGPPVLRTRVMVGTVDGKEVVVYSDRSASFSSGSIAQVGGATVVYVRYITTLTASSKDYNKFTVPSDASVHFVRFAVDLKTNCVAINPHVPTIAYFNINQDDTKFFDVGTEYNVARTFMSVASGDYTIWYGTDAIIQKLKDLGCLYDNADYSFVYSIGIDIRASGIGNLPHGVYQETVITPFHVALGSITAVGLTTVGSG